MKKLPIILLVILFATCTIANADMNKRKEAAEQLLNVMNLKESLKASIDQMLQLQLQQSPEMVPYKDVILEFFNKYMSYESLKGDFINIYADTFTEDELKEITVFYKTPAGQKTVEKLPELMTKGAQIGAMRV